MPVIRPSALHALQGEVALTREMATRVEESVVSAIEDNRLELPNLPLVAARALAMLGRDDFSFAQIATLIETDPIVAARLVRLTHSAAFASLSRFDSVLTCLTRLGAEELRLFLVETAVHHVLESRDPCIAQMCRDLWRHSLAVAILSRELATAVHALHPDAAYLVGLLHDVGRPVLAATLLDAEQRLLGTRTQRWIMPSAWLNIISGKHRSVGEAIARKWGLPEPVVNGIRCSAEYDTGDRFATANVVLLADTLAKREGIYVGPINAEEIESRLAQGKQLLSVDDAIVERLVTDLADRVSSRIG
ncbi:MAG TPA: HDOD domain-containing protein [Polyangia bacterium]